MKKIIASLLFVALAYSSNGKLVGTVVQKSDNAPAVGVNIIIVDTYLGAASDERGKFVILNIPPGSYSVRADAIGFAPVIVKDVRITTSFQASRFICQPPKHNNASSPGTATKPTKNHFLFIQ